MALLPLTAVAGEVEAGLLREVALADLKPPPRQLVAIRRRDRGAPSGAVAAFLDTVSSLADELKAA